MLRFSRGVAVAAAAVALAARSSFASDGADSLLDELIDNGKGGADSSAAEAAETEGTLASLLGLTPVGEDTSESLEVRVAEVQGISQGDLKMYLRSMYSTSKDAQEKQLYPPGCLEGVQELLNGLGSVDDEQRDFQQFLDRFIFLVGKTVERYSDFFALKVRLGDPSITPEEYSKEAKKLPVLAAKWTDASNLLIAFLEKGARDLGDKWGKTATTERRLRDAIDFANALQETYEAQQQLFRSGYGLAQLRYLQHDDRQADLSLLMESSQHKQATTDFEDALENAKEKCHQARRVGKRLDEDFLPQGYLGCLPFPVDKQREADDLPFDDEM